MIAALATSVLVAGLLLAAWTGGSAALRRPVNAAQIIAGIAVETALIAQSAIALVRLARGERLAEPATFVAYSIGVLAPLILGGQLARLERSRWGSLALCFTAVVVAVMTLRLQQIWRAGGA
jgi:hypothetical protein